MARVGQEGYQMEANMSELFLMMLFRKRLCQSAATVERSLGRSKTTVLLVGFPGEQVAIQSFLVSAGTGIWIIFSV